jgi:outer membrane lipoprotein carrier protein
MISRSKTSASGLLALLLAGAVAAGCAGDADRPGVGEDGRDTGARVDEPVAAEPGTLEGPDAGATPVTGSDEAVLTDPDAADDAAAPTPDHRAGAAPAQPGPGSSAPSPTPPADGSRAPSTDAILRATARTYEAVRSIQADFEQELRNPLLGRTTRSRGTLYQRQPDRFLMQFSDPDGDVIVSDGQFFWLYYPSVDARQVIRAPRGPQGLDMHSQFIGDPASRFTATPHGTEMVRGRSAHVLTLVPREALGYRSLKVWIDSDDHLVRRFELTEETGNVRRFELSNVVVNPSLPDRLFQFTPPAGAQVIQR